VNVVGRRDLTGPAGLPVGFDREVSRDAIGLLIGRGHNSGIVEYKGGLGLLSYLLSALHYQTILYGRPRRRHYLENLEIESYSRYNFSRTQITYNIAGQI